MFAAVVGQSWAIAAHPYNIEVNGVDVIGQVYMSSIVVDMAGPGSNGSLTFTITDPTAAVTINEWDEVRFIEHGASRPILFGGFVQSARYVVWARTGRDIEVRCVGYGILLDKKVVVAFTASTTFTRLPVAIQHLVNRYGGRLSALMAPVIGNPSNAIYSIPNMTRDFGPDIATETFPDLAGVTIRSGIDDLAAVSAYDQAGGRLPASVAVWADGRGLVMILPDLLDGTTDIDLTVDDYTAAVTVNLASPSASFRVVGLAYEREDTARATSAYVVGADAAGSGFYRMPALERAGDLEVVVSDTTSTSAARVSDLGSAAVAATEYATAYGELALAHTATVAVWPGLRLILSSAQLGLSSAYFRILGVRITFESSSSRTYAITFGGNVPRPSRSRPTGRPVTPFYSGQQHRGFNLRG